MKNLLFLLLLICAPSHSKIIGPEVEIVGTLIKLESEWVEIKTITGKNLRLARKLISQKIHSDTKTIRISYPASEAPYLLNKNEECFYILQTSNTKPLNTTCNENLCTGKVSCGTPVILTSDVVCNTIEGKCPDAKSCFEDNVSTVTTSTDISPPKSEATSGSQM